MDDTMTSHRAPAPHSSGARRHLVVRAGVLVGLVGALVLALVAAPVLVGSPRLSVPATASSDGEAVGRPLATTGRVDGDERSGTRAERADVVLVVMDDFSRDLVQTMPHLLKLREQGAVYRNAFVVDSLCCPSRAATFTGLPPHLNGVRSNTSGGPLGALGGYEAFEANGDVERSYNVALRAAGHRTGFVGKYLNEYEPPLVDGERQPPPYVPGWDDFQAVSGGAYQGWGFYRTTRHGTSLDLTAYPAPDPDDPAEVVDETYGTNVIADQSVELIEKYQEQERRTGEPWLLHVAPYGTHSRTGPSWPGEPFFPPAFSDRPGGDRALGNCGAVACADLTTDDLPGYRDPRGDNVPTYLDDDGTTREATSWRTNEITLSDGQAEGQLRDRAQMAQSIDRMLGRIMRTIGPDTYLVVTSDNGYHLGQYGLNGGKGTPYDSDTHVPLVVTGPGVVPGPREQWVSNTDLASTLEDLAGVRPDDEARVGTSFAPSLTRPDADGPRFVFFEHLHGPVLPGEPDADLGSGGRLDVIPSYVAVRGARGLLVRVDLDQTPDGVDHAWELYDYADQPWEDVNVFARDHDRAWARNLMRRLEAWDGCAPAACRRLTR